MILQSKELENVKKELKDKTVKLKYAEQFTEVEINYFSDLFYKEKEKVKRLEEKDETKLKEVYEKEI